MFPRSAAQPLLSSKSGGPCNRYEKIHDRIDRRELTGKIRDTFPLQTVWEVFSMERQANLPFDRSREHRRSLLSIMLIVAPLLSGCCACGRPLLWHDGISQPGFLTRRDCLNEETPEGFPRQMIGYPQFAGEHDRKNRIAEYGHPNYHNEYPTPDYPLVPYANRVNGAMW